MPQRGGARDDVVLEDPVAGADALGDDAGGVPVAVPAAGQPLVVARELLAVLVEPVLVDLAGGGVDGEAGQVRRSPLGPGEVGREHPVVAHRVDDDVGAVLGVEVWKT